MSVAYQAQDHRQQIYADLISLSPTSPNQEWLTCIVASWCDGQGVLPDYLGLEAGQFNRLIETFYPGSKLPSVAPSGSQLDFNRMLEREDLVRLLNHFRQADNVEVDFIIQILVAGCLGNDHLWQDLGLWSRPQLTAMLQYNFPELAAKNNQDMKWKKFLYKLLCEAEGIYVCRAPSCQVCVDYPKCYGNED